MGQQTPLVQLHFSGTNETFTSFTAGDYAMSILTVGGGAGVQGDLVDMTDTICFWW